MTYYEIILYRKYTLLFCYSIYIYIYFILITLNSVIKIKYSIYIHNMYYIYKKSGTTIILNTLTLFKITYIVIQIIIFIF